MEKSNKRHSHSSSQSRQSTHSEASRPRSAHSSIHLEAQPIATTSTSTCLFDSLNDDILSKIFRAVVGRPYHGYYQSTNGTRQDSDDDFFGDRKGIIPTQNPEYPMVFVLPLVCRRWRQIMFRYPAIWSRASVSVKCASLASTVPLTWWSQHAVRLESLYLDGHSVIGLGNLSALNNGVLSLLNPAAMRALCLGDCFLDGASSFVLSAITYLSNLQQLQVYKANPSFIAEISKLTKLSMLKVLELGYQCSSSDYPFTALSAKNFPISLEKLSLCEAIIDMDVGENEHLINLKSLKLMTSVVSGRFCEHIGELPKLKKLVCDDSSLVGDLNTTQIDSDYLPDDLHKLSALHRIKNLTIKGPQEGQRGYFEWLGEEVLREPPFDNLQSLNLSFGSMGFMSENFDAYTSLRYIYIEQIKFETIPEPILVLPSLTKLEMVTCDISTFPDSIPLCSETISVLSLAGNRLRVIPHGLANWKSLLTLDLTENPIMGFANIECLLKLPRLRRVMMLEGEKSLDMDSLEFFCQEFDCMHSALRLGYICAKLSDKEPNCRVFL